MTATMGVSSRSVIKTFHSESDNGVSSQSVIKTFLFKYSDNECFVTECNIFYSDSDNGSFVTECNKDFP